jgi:carbamate kinase
MSRIVVALGGNALGNSPEEQLILVQNTVKPIAELIKAGHEVLIAHGNGPQVGMINMVFETAEHDKVIKHAMPFPECGAMSQGYIGFHLQNALRAELNRLGIDKEVSTLITEVEVDPNDPAFLHPSKPIGSFCSEAEAKVLEATKGYMMKEDSGRGYRRVVASPKPINVVGIKVIRCLVEA